MQEELKVNLNDIKLHDFENIIKISRNVDVGKHLPQGIIGKGAEFTNIRTVENLELSKLWRIANRIMRDTFIHFATEDGIKAYEKLMRIEAKGSLDERRKKVYAVWNKKSKWTHRTLEEWLEETVGLDNCNFELHYNDYKIEFKIYLYKEKLNHQWLLKELRKIVPANLGFIFKLISYQNIYYGMYAQTAKKHLISPAKPQNKNISLGVYFGGGVVCKKVIRSLKVSNVFIKENGGTYEVTGPNGEVLDYER